MVVMPMFVVFAGDGCSLSLCEFRGRSPLPAWLLPIRGETDQCPATPYSLNTNAHQVVSVYAGALLPSAI